MTRESSNFISENEANFMQSNQGTPVIAIPGNQESLSPRELIRYHIENPEVPITDEDIRNLDLRKELVIDFVADEFSRD